jgi:hypothetical protein
MTGSCRCGCGRRARYRSSGLAHTCHTRWLRLGRPAVLPPPRTRRGVPNRSRLARIEDYRDLLAWQETPQMAAARLDVSERTIRRYGAALRSGAA